MSFRSIKSSVSLLFVTINIRVHEKETFPVTQRLEHLISTHKLCFAHSQEFYPGPNLYLPRHLNFPKSSPYVWACGIKQVTLLTVTSDISRLLQ